MTEKRFTVEHFEDTDWAYDNGKSIYTREMVDLLNIQHETIQNLNQRIDDYLTEVNYQLEQGTDFKDTYVRYSRFKQILEELRNEINLRYNVDGDYG